MYYDDEGEDEEKKENAGVPWFGLVKTGEEVKVDVVMFSSPILLLANRCTRSEASRHTRRVEQKIVDHC